MSKQKNGMPQTVEYTFPQPKPKSTIQQIIYDTRDGTLFGRTPASWSKLLVFYTIFYIILAAIFAISMQGLFATLDDTRPSYVLERSLIGTSPGLGFRPLNEETEFGSMIRYNETAESYEFWIDLLKKFFKPYNVTKNQSEGKHRIECDFNKTLTENNVCEVAIHNFGPCSEENSFGYPDKPCIFLKLNKIFDWKPIFMTDTNDLPKDMPDNLRDRIGNTTVHERDQIWVSCKGQRPKDEDLLKEANTKIEYIPNQGFPKYYYPYRNLQGYLSPVVAVRFVDLPLNTLVNIECRAWAKNIAYNPSLRDRQGSVLFQLEKSTFGNKNSEKTINTTPSKQA